jgi:hypothetical protein
MNYALDNIPGLTEHGTDLETAGAAAGPHDCAFLQALPNPFNPAVTLRLAGPLEKAASLKIFDLSGRLVADLSGKIRNGSAAWNAHDGAGRTVAAGIYVAVLRHRHGVQRLKLVLAR